MNNCKSWNERAEKNLFFAILDAKNVGIITGGEWSTIGQYMRAMGHKFTDQSCRQHFQSLRRAQKKEAGNVRNSHGGFMPNIANPQPLPRGRPPKRSLSAATEQDLPDMPQPQMTTQGSPQQTQWLQQQLQLQEQRDQEQHSGDTQGSSPIPQEINVRQPNEPDQTQIADQEDQQVLYEKPSQPESSSEVAQPQPPVQTQSQELPMSLLQEPLPETSLEETSTPMDGLQPSEAQTSATIAARNESAACSQVTGLEESKSDPNILSESVADAATPGEPLSESKVTEKVTSEPSTANPVQNQEPISASDPALSFDNHIDHSDEPPHKRSRIEDNLDCSSENNGITSPDLVDEEDDGTSNLNENGE